MIICIGMGKWGSSVHGNQGSSERSGGARYYLNRPFGSADSLRFRGEADHCDST